MEKEHILMMIQKIKNTLDNTDFTEKVIEYLTKMLERSEDVIIKDNYIKCNNKKFTRKILFDDEESLIKVYEEGKYKEEGRNVKFKTATFNSVQNGNGTFSRYAEQTIITPFETKIYKNKVIKEYDEGFIYYVNFLKTQVAIKKDDHGRVIGRNSISNGSKTYNTESGLSLRSRYYNDIEKYFKKFIQNGIILWDEEITKEEYNDLFKNNIYNVKHK